MIAANFLGDDAHLGFAIKPKISEKFAAKVGGCLLRAGRLVVGEKVEGFEHFVQTRTKELKKSLRKGRASRHGENMVTPQKGKNIAEAQRFAPRHKEERGQIP